MTPCFCASVRISLLASSMEGWGLEWPTTEPTSALITETVTFSADMITPYPLSTLKGGTILRMMVAGTAEKCGSGAYPPDTSSESHSTYAYVAPLSRQVHSGLVPGRDSLHTCAMYWLYIRPLRLARALMMSVVPDPYCDDFLVRRARNG